MRVVWMYGAMHWKSTSATPILIVESVTPVPMVFEIGALLPDAPDPAFVVVDVPVFVPLPQAASTSATASSSAPHPVRRAVTSIPLSCARAEHYGCVTAGARDTNRSCGRRWSGAATPRRH